MLSFPLIIRELRVQSRDRSTYGARVGWGLGAVALLGFFSWSFPAQAANGKFVLSALHICLGVMLLLLAPIGAADAISREKREGTLGLLLLTHVTPTQVIVGKLSAHIIRVFYFGFMMLPFLIIPVLMGGVAFEDFLLSAVVLFTIVMAGISGGLIASAMFTSFAASLSCALFLTAFIATLISAIAINGVLTFVPNAFPPNVPGLLRIFFMGPALLTFPLAARDLSSRFFTSPWFYPLLEAALVVLCLLFLLYAVAFCRRKVGQHAEFAGETKGQAAFRRTFLKPIVWRDRFRRSMSRKLDRNPFIWLEYRTPWARAARWSMVLGAVVAETMLIMDLPNLNAFLGTHFMFVSLLLVFLTLKCASSFQREKESGAFELLLVTPLTDKKIVAGRLSAIASYYGLAVFTLAACGFFGLTWAQTYSYYEYELSSAVYLFSVCASLIRPSSRMPGLSSRAIFWVSPFFKLKGRPSLCTISPVGSLPIS